MTSSAAAPRNTPESILTTVDCAVAVAQSDSPTHAQWRLLTFDMTRCTRGGLDREAASAAYLPGPLMDSGSQGQSCAYNILDRNNPARFLWTVAAAQKASAIDLPSREHRRMSVPAFSYLIRCSKQLLASRSGSCPARSFRRRPCALDTPGGFKTPGRGLGFLDRPRARRHRH